MKRVGMTWQIDPARWDEYKAIHLNPWPKLLHEIQAVGIHNYSIFAFGTRVFAYMEIDGDDPYVALARLSETDVKKQWDQEVTVMVLPEAAEGAGVQFMDLPSIFFCP
jgi:L-rhamnose mutarotase